MFTELPDLFDRKFATGFLLPAILLALGTVILSSYAFGLRWISIKRETVLNSQAQLILVQEIESATFLFGLFAFGCFVLAIVLLVSNRLLIRFLEGYHPPISWLKGWGKWRYRRLDKLRKGLIKQMKAEKVVNQGNINPKTWENYRKVLIKQVKSFPHEERFVLATAFGNTIRAAETYSFKMYGADIIAIWPRLWPFMDAEFREALEDAKASLDFVINLFYVGCLLVVELLLFIWLGPQDLFHSPIQIQWVLILVLLLATIVFSYYLAVSRAADWGVYVRAASDIYLERMLEKLGMKTPKDAKLRRALWTQISQSFTYLTPLPTEPGEEKVAKSGVNALLRIGLSLVFVVIGLLLGKRIASE